MSHEIRTPLHGILGTVQLLRETVLSHEQCLLLDTLVRSGDHLLALVNDVLDYSGMAVNAIVLKSADFDVWEVFGFSRDLLAPKAMARGVALAVDIADDVPVRLRGDAVRLRQVVLNILGNSVKFTDIGQIDVAVRMHAEADGRVRLLVTITDTGIGISDAAVGRLFTEFSQADDTIAPRFGGTGLGLAISRKLIEAMGGTVRVTSVFGRGSVFSFDVVLDRAAEDVPEPTVFTRTAIPRTLRILLVDDNQTNLLVGRLLLERMGHSVVPVDSGAAALREFAAGVFDLVQMDMLMPGMDGLETTRRLRAMGGAGAAVPVFGLTASTLASDEAACLAAGMQAVLTKPFRREAFAAKCAELLMK